MIKKGFAIFVLLLANIIMLAHSIIPHHYHHSEAVCVEQNECETSCNSHETKAEHSHHNSEDIRLCKLDKILVKPIEFNFSINLKIEKANNTLLSQAITESFLTHIQNKSIALAKRQYSLSQYTYCVLNNSIGRRGPPTV